MTVFRKILLAAVVRESYPAPAMYRLEERAGTFAF